MKTQLIEKYASIKASQTEQGLKYYASPEAIKLAGYTASAKTKMQASLEVIEDDETPAGVLLAAIRNLFGFEGQMWDPEVLWLELDRDHGVDVPAENRDKILAALALIETHSFYWDAGVFEKTVMSFNDIGADIDIIQEPDPEHLCWGVTEAAFILQGENQQLESFNTEPQAYVATVLKREGFVLAPEPLEFSQEALDLQLGGYHAGPSKDEVKKNWDRVSRAGWSIEDILKTPVPETQLGIQVKRLAECQAYVQERVARYDEWLQRVA